MRSWRSEDEQFLVGVTDHAVEQMTRMALAARPLEVASRLVGTYFDRGNGCKVRWVTPVPRGSVPGATTFECGDGSGYFARLWRRTVGRVYYVGEWHSHPEGPCEPSPTDAATMRAIAQDEKAECPEAIQMIAATRGDSIVFDVRIYRRRQGSSVKLSEVDR